MHTILASILVLLLVAAARPVAAQWMPWNPAQPIGITGVTALAAHRNGTVVAAGNAGVYASLDSGRTWSARGTVTTPAFTIHHLAFDSSGVLYAGGTGNNPALHRSTDAGATWQSLPFEGGSAAALAVGPDGDVVAGGSGTPLRRSTDGGASWQTLGLASAEGSLAITTSGLMVTARGGLVPAIVRSVDGGATWQAVDGGAGYTPLSFAIDAAGTLYGVIDSAGVRTLVRFDADATTMTRVAAPDMHAVAALADGTIILGTVVDGVLRSSDGGTTWERTTLEHGDGREIAIVDRTIHLVGATGPFRSTDGGDSWRSSVRAIPGMILRSISAVNYEFVVVAEESGAFLTPSNDDPTWLGPGSRAFRRIGATDPVDYAVAAPDGSVLTAPIVTRRSPMGIWSFVAPDGDAPLVAGRAIGASATGELAIATNDGTVWVASPGTAFRRVAIPDGEIVSHPSALVYPGGSNRFLLIDNGGVWRRAFGTDSLERSATPAVLGGLPYLVAFDEQDQSTAVVVSDSSGREYVMQTYYLDGTWTRLPDLPGRFTITGVVAAYRTISVAVQSLDAPGRSTVFTYERWDDDDEWVDDRPPIDDVIVGIANTRYERAIATRSQGIFTSPYFFGGVDDTAPREPIASIDAIHDHATSRLRLRVDVPRAGHYTARLVDVRGHARAVLFDGPIVQGVSEIGVDAEGFPSGVYGIVMTGGDRPARALLRIVR